MCGFLALKSSISNRSTGGKFFASDFQKPLGPFSCRQALTRVVLDLVACIKIEIRVPLNR